MKYIKRTVTYTTITYILVSESESYFKTKKGVRFRDFDGNPNLERVDSELSLLHGCKIIVIKRDVKTEIFRLPVLDFIKIAENITYIN